MQVTLLRNLTATNWREALRLLHVAIEQVQEHVNKLPLPPKTQRKEREDWFERRDLVKLLQEFASALRDGLTKVRGFHNNRSNKAKCQMTLSSYLTRSEEVYAGVFHTFAMLDCTVVQPQQGAEITAEIPVELFKHVVRVH